MKRHQIGKKGEEIAVTFLEKQNYQIIERNFQKQSGEIDIITFDPEFQEYVFVEVKTRRGNQFGYPEESVQNDKIEKIINTAYIWFDLQKIITDNWRIDIIAIELFDDQTPKITHLQNIS